MVTGTVPRNLLWIILCLAGLSSTIHARPRCRDTLAVYRFLPFAERAASGPSARSRLDQLIARLEQNRRTVDEPLEPATFRDYGKGAHYKIIKPQSIFGFRSPLLDNGVYDPHWDKNLSAYDDAVAELKAIRGAIENDPRPEDVVDDFVGNFAEVSELLGGLACDVTQQARRRGSFRAFLRRSGGGALFGAAVTCVAGEVVILTVAGLGYYYTGSTDFYFPRSIDVPVGLFLTGLSGGVIASHWWGREAAPSPTRDPVVDAVVRGLQTHLARRDLDEVFHGVVPFRDRKMHILQHREAGEEAPMVEVFFTYR